MTRHPDAALSISYGRVANIISNERKSYWISNKESLENLSTVLENHNVHKKYFQKHLITANRTDGDIIFFADDGVLSRLNNAKALYIDGNFKVISSYTFGTFYHDILKITQFKKNVSRV